ncbi:hypothetical protein [Thalassotalea atypica]|uniref:hypothetical protein n=1 Tax=Thalassotalea atypica TaxID=2054316 RepID=UPI002573163D|nr:hypothetical protein [Thalassotalea atypica]
MEDLIKHSAEIKSLAQATQAIFISLATIMAGIWAVFRLFATDELKKQKAESIQKQVEVNQKKGLKGDMSIILGEKTNSGTPVFIEVKIENQSSSTHTLDWCGYALKIAAVSFIESEDQDGHRHKLDPITKLNPISINKNGSEDYFSGSTSLTIFPSTERIVNFYWLMKHEGVFIASISAPMPESIEKHMLDTSVDLPAVIENSEKQFPEYKAKFQFNVSRYFQVN